MDVFPDWLLNKLVFWFIIFAREDCITFIFSRHFPTHCLLILIRHQKVLFQIETFVWNYVHTYIQNCFVWKSSWIEQSMNDKIETLDKIETIDFVISKHLNFSLSCIWWDTVHNISHSFKFLGMGFKLGKSLFPNVVSKWTAMFSQRPLRSPDWSPPNHQLSK